MEATSVRVNYENFSVWEVTLGLVVDNRIIIDPNHMGARMNI